MELALYKNIVIDPEVCGGKPVFKGTRLTVKTILEFMLAGETEQNILEAYPFISGDDLNTAREFSIAAMEKGIHAIVPINGEA